VICKAKNQRNHQQIAHHDPNTVSRIFSSLNSTR
jgi:hypothetical protein